MQGASLDSIGCLWGRRERNVPGKGPVVTVRLACIDRGNEEIPLGSTSVHLR